MPDVLIRDIAASDLELLEEKATKAGLSCDDFLRQILSEQAQSGECCDLENLIPNAETIAAIEEGRRIANDPNVKGYTSIAELRADLGV